MRLAQTARNYLDLCTLSRTKRPLCWGIANFNATLPYRALATGATSKATDFGQTRQHGEGLKLSALVWRRNNYLFDIMSGSNKWNMIWKKGELACGLRQLSEKVLDKAKSNARGQPRNYVAHPWEDVCVTIGAAGTARDAYGEKMRGEHMHVDLSRDLLDITLDVDPPAKMVCTEKGDLIVDPRYQGKMYLCGLQLPSGGTSDKPYAYGYNFVDGTTTRDRDSLAGAGEKCNRIAAI